ncbi:MAG: asparagine synthase (glutamine-hydrolyzing), partial [Hyphomicrobium sp.]
MCGIAGGLWRDRRNDVDKRVDAAISAMRHRGPNDSGKEIVSGPHGMAALGHTRLSIIDLAGGRQPMQSQDASLVLVFNGEIYNYRELRDELRALGRSFRSQSDTEVLLAAWEQWGKACLARFEGMFAFALLDRTRMRLTCARDAFGIKPFFYSHDDDGFLFASEQRALLALRGRPAKADVQRAYDYLVHGDYDSRERTFVEGVRHLPPGSLIELDLAPGKRVEPSLWWKASTAETSALSFGQAAEALRARFIHNIKLHLRSDVPLGVNLSGGLDSSAVACAIRHVEPKMPINTFSYIADGADVSEEAWVDTINTAIDAKPHKVRASAEDLARDLDAIVMAQGEPFGSTSIYAQYRVFGLARESGVTVTLDGQGADELLAGYVGYPGHRLLSLLERGRIGAMHGFARRWATWPGRSYRQAWMHLGRTIAPDRLYGIARKVHGRDFKPRWLKTSALEDAGVRFNEARPPLAKGNGGRRVVEQMAYSLQTRGLPHLLRHADRSSMAFSIESRVPFLTTPMADFLLSLPESYLISDG